MSVVSAAADSALKGSGVRSSDSISAQARKPKEAICRRRGRRGRRLNRLRSSPPSPPSSERGWDKFREGTHLRIGGYPIRGSGISLKWITITGTRKEEEEGPDSGPVHPRAGERGSTGLLLSRWTPMPTWDVFSSLKREIILSLLTFIYEQT